MSEQSPGPKRRARLWRHLKRNFLGYTALVVALSMTPLPAYAATLIGTRNIKNGAVTTAKLHTGAVTAAKIAAGAVTAPAIGGGAVGNSAIAAGAVNGSSIADGSVGAADLGSGVAYRDLVFKEFTESGVTAGSVSTKYLICPAGYVAIGGGASTTIVLDAGTLQMSVPVKSGFLTLPTGDGQVPDGWRTDVLVTTGTQSVYHYAVCASK